MVLVAVSASSDSRQEVPVVLRHDLWRVLSSVARLLTGDFRHASQGTAKQLGISDREAARQCGLEERRYAHYSVGQRQPDLETLVRIAQRLATTPNWLLGLDATGKKAMKSEILIERLAMGAPGLSDEELRIVTIQVEALIKRR